jgi:hypothetical protein
VSEEELTRRRHRPKENRLAATWRKYRFELIWLFVVGLGLFLVLEQMSIRASLAAWSHRIVRGLLGGIRQLDGGFESFVARLSFSDVVGLLLIAAAVVAILLRIRWRLLNDPGLTTVACPKCGGAIHRTHRTGLDRLIGLYVPVRRYRCGNADCRWRGLRVGEHQGASRQHARSTG